MLISTIAEFRERVSVSKGFTFERFRDALDEATRVYILPVLGQDLIDDLQEHHDGSDSDDMLDAILEATQKCLAAFAYYIVIPKLEVNMYETGLHALSDDKYKSANQRQAGDYRSAHLTTAYNRLEELYDVLMEYAGSLPTWVASTGYSSFNSSLLRNAREFTEVYSIGNSHLTYVDLKPAIERAQQLEMRKRIGQEFYDSLIEHVRGEDDSDSDAPDTEMLDEAVALLRPALAHFTIAYARELQFKMVNGALLSTRYDGNSANDVKVIDERLHKEFATTTRANAMKTGFELLSIAQAWLDEHAEDLPLYLNGPGYREDGIDERPVDERMHNTDSMMMV